MSPISFFFPLQVEYLLHPKNISSWDKTAKFYAGHLEVNVVKKIISMNRVK